MAEPLLSFGLPSELLVWQAIFFTVLSFAVGIVGGMVGLALGTVRLPFLLLLGVPAPVAGGTNILVSTLSALTGSYRHFKEGRVDLYVVAVQGIPAIVGAFIGGFAAGLLNEGLLIFLAGVLVAWQGGELWLRALIRSKRSVSNDSPAGPGNRGLARWTSGRIVAEAIAGLAIGFLGGAVGLILGTLRLPALIVILNIDPRVAAGSNLVIGFLLGGFGWIGHAVRGQVDYPLLVLMGATGMVGTYYGAWLTGKISIRNLLYLMAIVLLVVGALLIRNGYGRF